MSERPKPRGRAWVNELALLAGAYPDDYDPDATVVELATELRYVVSPLLDSRIVLGDLADAADDVDRKLNLLCAVTIVDRARHLRDKLTGLAEHEVIAYEVDGW